MTKRADKLLCRPDRPAQPAYEPHERRDIFEGILKRYGVSTSASDRDKLLVERLMSDPAMARVMEKEVLRQKKLSSDEARRSRPTPKRTIVEKQTMARLFAEYSASRLHLSAAARMNGFSRTLPAQFGNSARRRNGAEKISEERLQNILIDGERLLALERLTVADLANPSLTEAICIERFLHACSLVRKAGREALKAMADEAERSKLTALKAEADEAELSKLFAEQILLGDGAGSFVHIAKK